MEVPATRLLEKAPPFAVTLAAIAGFSLKPSRVKSFIVYAAGLFIVNPL
jgi:hypothetical protein